MKYVLRCNLSVPYNNSTMEDGPIGSETFLEEEVKSGVFEFPNPLSVHDSIEVVPGQILQIIDVTPIIHRKYSLLETYAKAGFQKTESDAIARMDALKTEYAFVKDLGEPNPAP